MSNLYINENLWISNIKIKELNNNNLEQNISDIYKLFHQISIITSL